ncbi:MAG: FAD-dependent oxidoreductase, partial [Rhodobacterales bacterium]
CIITMTDGIVKKTVSILENNLNECLEGWSNAKILETWAGVRPKARRRDLMIGPVPEVDGVFVAMGGFKVGFGLAHKVGVTLADLIQNKPTNLPKSFTIEHHLE